MSERRDAEAAELAMVLILTMPALDYYPMFLTALTGPVQGLYARLLHVRRPRDARGPR